MLIGTDIANTADSAPHFISLCAGGLKDGHIVVKCTLKGTDQDVCNELVSEMAAHVKTLIMLEAAA